jgi:hypothetical protein
MKQAKDRVVAIDYFRGIFILVAVVNHGMLFTMPFAYLTGASRLWTSAAEMLLLISGLTFGIIRGEKIKSEFKAIYKKTLRRAAQIYVVNILVVALSLLVALFAISHNLTNDVDGVLPSRSGFSLLWSIMNLSYSIGWGGFLCLFAVFLTAAPLAMYILRSRYWVVVPLASLSFYILNSAMPGAFGDYSNYALWQIYFFSGLLLAKFRIPALNFIYSLKINYRKTAAISLLSLTAVILALCILFEDNNILYPRVTHLAAAGWLPDKAIAAYQHLLALKPTVDNLLMDSRTGVLRPLFSLFSLAALYALFQSFKTFWLAKTGKVILTLGKDTLWIFAAQALVIPLLAMIPLQRDNLLNNAALTSALLVVMWGVTKRSAMKPVLQSYAAELRYSYNSAKYGYLQRFETEET